jgi:histidinol-phosphatase (PHP family)
MSFSQSLHNHSTFDDGKSAPEEMVRAAAAAGLTGFGITAHSPMDGEPWTVAPERMADFRAEMARLRALYAGRMDVWCGLEYDLTSDPKWLAGFDYVIASVHALRTDTGLWALDDTRERSRRMIVLAFDGDADAAAEAYFQQVKAIADIPEADVVGHFDLITKFDEPEPLYQAASPRYRAAALDAMEALARAGKIFEINTGAVSRAYRTAPYPAPELLCALNEMGGRITNTADAHSAGNVTFGFNMAARAAEAAGFRELWEFSGRDFVPRAVFCGPKEAPRAK